MVFKDARCCKHDRRLSVIHVIVTPLLATTPMLSFHFRRKCLRLRFGSAWIIIGFVGLFAIIMVMILVRGLHGDGINWTHRPGINLRDAPYGRSLSYHDHSVKLNINTINELALKRRTLHITRGVGAGGDASVGGGGGAGVKLKEYSSVSRSKNISREKSHEVVSAGPVYDVQLSIKPPLDLLNGVDFTVFNLPPDSNSHHIGCDEIATLTLHRRIGRGTTKDVYASVYNDKKIAVKMVSPKVQDIKACLRRKMFRNKEECYVYANYKMMKEIALAQQLHHPNIVKLIGYCIQSGPLLSRQRDHGVISVVEFGAKASLHRLAQMNWDQRLQASTELADLLDYFEHSPLGSIAIWDYKHSQFIVSEDNLIKYSDMDDLSGDEPECQTEAECVLPKNHMFHMIKLKCVHSRCHGHNAKFNLFSTTKEFFRPLLTDPPVECQKQIETMFEKLKNLTIDAREVKTILTELKQLKTKDLSGELS